MDGPLPISRGRGMRGSRSHVRGTSRGRGHSQNKHWSASGSPSRPITPSHSDGERWERGGHRGGGRGFNPGIRGATRKFPNVSLRLNNPTKQPQDIATPANPTAQQEEQELIDEEMHYEEEEQLEDEVNGGVVDEEEEEEEEEPPYIIHEPEIETQEERDKFWQELVKAREVERKKAIAEGTMDDPLVPKRLEDAITIVGTCMDMCPRYERYRRERENNLFEWETIPGTKRVDHNRAVKMYERAAGDKTIPSDLRPPEVLKRTLNYLFHDLLPRGGFTATHTFIRDRSRAVRNDFTMQHITGPYAIECHDRCARFHIVALHILRDTTGFSIPLEEQQLMNTLQSLKEFYEDQRGTYQSPTELEMRVYHRLIHIRDQRDRHDDVPDQILNHPVFKLTTDFRLHVQRKSAPITKTSALVVDAQAMEIFGRLAGTLREMGNLAMIYLVACILERLFGKDTIEDIESIRGSLSLSDIIDGISSRGRPPLRSAIEEEIEVGLEEDDIDTFLDDDDGTAEAELQQPQPVIPSSIQVTSSPWSSARIAPVPTFPTLPASQPSAPVIGNAFSGIVSRPSPFAQGSVFSTGSFPAPKPPATSVFGNQGPTPSVFGTTFPASSSSTPAPSTVATPSNPFGIKPTPSPFIFQPSPPIQSQTSSPFPNTPPPTSLNGSSQSKIREIDISAPHAFPSTQSQSFSLDPKASPFTPPLQPSSPIAQPLASRTSFSNPSQAAGSQSFNFTPPPKEMNNRSNFFTPPNTPPILSSKPSLPTSSGPPLAANGTRLTAPPLLKINTNTSTSSSSGSQGSHPSSPRVPPPAPKHQPIPLPQTPTANPLLGHIRQNLDYMSSGSGFGSPTPDVLSPLVMGTPTSSSNQALNNFSPLSTPMGRTLKRRDTNMSFLELPPPRDNAINGKGKERQGESPKYDENALRELEEKALAFERRSTVVKDYFSRWLKRTTDRAAWLEACQHEARYRQKLQKSQLRPPLARSEFSADRKRRISMNSLSSSESGLSPMKKRARKRISMEYRPPRTDEELAQRFKENQKEHESRWAQGSFLRVIHRHVQRLNPSISEMPWHVWLSMNPESDATAIWLETKFNVPSSGAWLTEQVISISASPIIPPSPLPSNYPGLIVFECTPLGDTSDDLEKKYRILDDCARLREIIGSLPKGRYFVPSLLVISWTEENTAHQESEFLTMVKNLVIASTIQSYHVFTMTDATKDLDNRLEQSLQALDIDSHGKLIQLLSIERTFKIFEDPFSSFVNEWIDNCSNLGRFHWNLYGRVVEVCVVLLNSIAESIRSLLGLESPFEPLAPFEGSGIDDSDNAYDDANEWLSSVDSREDVLSIASDLQSHRNIGQDFPVQIFIQHLYELTLARFSRRYSSPSSSHTIPPFPSSSTSHLKSKAKTYPVLTSSIESSLQSIQETIRPKQMHLLQLYNFSARRSPKRRSGTTSYSVTSSEGGSPEAKRPRLSDSLGSSQNDIREGQDQTSLASPTPSVVSLAPTEVSMTTTTAGGGGEGKQPGVTVAMLRALTKDLKKKYIQPSR